MRPKLSQVSRRVLFVNDDEGTARGDRVRDEVIGLAEDAMVGRDGG